jgi:hypothetical protein
MAVPTKGTFMRDFLRKTLHIPGMAGRRMGGSRLETWLLRKMQDSPEGMFSAPWMMTRMPPARMPARMVNMAQLYMVRMLPRRREYGTPMRAAGRPKRVKTKSMLIAENMAIGGPVEVLLSEAAEGRGGKYRGLSTALRFGRDDGGLVAVEMTLIWSPGPAREDCGLE